MGKTKELYERRINCVTKSAQTKGFNPWRILRVGKFKRGKKCRELLSHITLQMAVSSAILLKDFRSIWYIFLKDISPLAFKKKIEIRGYFLCEQ